MLARKCSFDGVSMEALTNYLIIKFNYIIKIKTRRY